MGVDCRIRLPSNIKVDDVAKVVGVLLGVKPEQRNLSKSSPKDKDYYSCYVPGVTVTGLPSFPSMCEIGIVGVTIDNYPNKTFHYHFEGEEDDRLMMPRSTPINIAMGRRLVDFFGGKIDYQDCDDIDFNYSVPWKSKQLNSPEDGKEWQDFQQRIFDLKPISREEIAQCVQFAAYV